MGPFRGYLRNREPMLDVIRMHRDALRPIKARQRPAFAAARRRKSPGTTPSALGEHFGYKNSQVTVLAPTGTIGFMMDCDTTGIEPDLALVKYKKLVGGGVIKIVNNTVPQALMKLGYTPEQSGADRCLHRRERHDRRRARIEARALPVFDCSLAPMGGGRSITWRGHVRMMAAAQPFLSGAISKTINMPEESTVEDIMEAYIESWKLGLKAVAIYRDNSKRSQPLSAAGKKEDEKTARRQPTTPRPQWLLLRPGEAAPAQQNLFPARSAENCQPSATRSRTNSRSAATKATSPSACTTTARPAKSSSRWPRKAPRFPASWTASRFPSPSGLQYGVPLKALVDKFINTRFEPSGYTGNPQIRYAKSMLDYIGRWLGGKFISPDYLDADAAAAVTTETVPPVVAATPASLLIPAEPEASTRPRAAIDDAPSCSECGMLMTPNGSCYKCANCGSTSGCS